MDLQTKQMMETMQNTWHAFQEHLEETDKEVKRYGEESAETKQLLARIDARLSDIDKKHNELLVEKKRPGFSTSGGREYTEADKHKLASKGFRSGFHRLAEDEYAALNEGVGFKAQMEHKTMYADDLNTGGFWDIPQFVSSRVIEQIVVISPMRSVAEVMAISGYKLVMPKRTGLASASWAAEQNSATESNFTVGSSEVPVHELKGLIKLSRTNLEDAALDLGAYATRQLAEQFAFAEGKAFIVGTGVGQPEGIATNTSISSDAVTLSSGALPNGDILLTSMHNLKTVYRQNSTWLFNTKTLGSLRKLKDSQNRPLWQPFAAGDLPSTIYDRPYVEMNDMVDIATGGKLPIAIGDFKRAYVIADRVQMDMQQLNELYAVEGSVGYVARRRVGGQVLLPEAIRFVQTN